MGELLRVLQVEDTESDAALILRLLTKSGYSVEVERVEDGESMRRALLRGGWDVIIADYQLPQFDAPGALRVRNEVAPDIPLIVVSGTIGEDRAVDMIRAGAQDYVLKDRLTRLVSAIQREMREGEARREHQRVADQLRDRDEWLALAVDATNLGMFDFYPGSGRLVLSEAGRSHAGLPAGTELSYDLLMNCIHPEDRTQVDALIAKAMTPESGGGYSADYRTGGRDGRAERWLTAQGRVFFDAEGKPERFVGVTLDITQRKQLEAQFRQAQKMESLGMLAGGVAHDFNNLLTIISGFSRMAVDELPPLHPLRAHLDEVLNASGRAADLTRQLLAISRHQPAHTKVLSLNDLVSKVQKMLGRLIGEDVALSVVLHPAAGAVRADPSHIDQVILNLVVNARDAMPGGGRITIETSSRVLEGSFADSMTLLAPGPYATLTVTDTGTGMPPEVSARIFEPFFTTKQPGKGTGLGLSTVYGIVKQSGGMISVASEPGRGTKFTVFLPAVEESPEDAVADVPPAASGGTETILFAEDDAGVRKFVRASLEQTGYQVIECRNGLEAMEQARSFAGRIDLILSDVVMPEMGGAELSEQMKACRPGTPVLFISGYNDSIWPQTLGEEACLAKPFTRATLLARVRGALDRSRAAGA